MRKSLLIIAALIIAGCNSTKKGSSTSASKYTIENLGSLNAEQLNSTYPDANIEEGTGLFDEGTEERPFSILYPGTENELHITWKNTGRSEIHGLRYSKDGKWESETGVKVGITYDELVKLNGKKISFYGFGWDYSGAVDWNGGKLEKSGLRVFLKPQNNTPNKFYGDKLIDATDEEIEALDLTVGSIMIMYGV